MRWAPARAAPGRPASASPTGAGAALGLGGCWRAVLATGTAQLASRPPSFLPLCPVHPTPVPACLPARLWRRKYLEERSREARAELEEFDRRRREREAQAQRLWGQQERKEQEKEKER